ncbi:MAG: hypothetical protein EAZ30_08675 [Betaproteobacteria bacterium]|nr:MAG: hypothetical protein EAZ43_06260 [Betaproteobacteria bacterium]TAG47604.1 MAG: hypothetical protein EAZ30_08675 [Betaproteobacteria bacterium]
MIEFVSQVIRHTPLWVWAILVTLLILGIRQLRLRRIKPFVVLIAPLAFFVLGLVTSGRSMGAFLAWAAAMVVVATLVYFALRPVGGARYDASEQRLILPGSAWPLFFMMTIFLLNYVINVAQAIQPGLLAQAAWHLGTPALLGAISGAFVGRSLSLFALSRCASPVIA